MSLNIFNDNSFKHLLRSSYPDRVVSNISRIRLLFSEFTLYLAIFLYAAVFIAIVHNGTAITSFSDVILILAVLFLALAFTILTLKNTKKKILLIKHGVVTIAIIKDVQKKISNDFENSYSYDFQIEFLTKEDQLINTTINVLPLISFENKKNKIVYLPWDPSIAMFLKSFSQIDFDNIIGNK